MPRSVNPIDHLIVQLELVSDLGQLVAGGESVFDLAVQLEDRA
jgi:hypothetical protein